MSKPTPRYLVFDCESVADGALVSKLRYPGKDLDPQDAIARYRAELLAKYDSDFIPYTFQMPVSVAIVKVATDYHLMDVVALDEPEYRPHVIVEHFWRGWEKYRHPTFVTFNGRGFDLPLMELAAFRFGLSVPAWIDVKSRTYDQPRNRYNQDSHIDLQDTLTNFGATRFTGGLSLAATVLGKPGKMDVQGDMVQDMFDEGRLKEINDYCRWDALDTYFVFLRTRVLMGILTLAQEQILIKSSRNWLESKVKKLPAYGQYLEHWGRWENPWSPQADVVGDE